MGNNKQGPIAFGEMSFHFYVRVCTSTSFLRVRTPRSEKKKRDLAEQKIDQEIALINANLSMRKCMSSLDRLEKENRMLRNQFLQRLLIGNRKKIRNAFETWR